MIRMVNLSCPKCGMSLDIDIRNVQPYCPSCGGDLNVTVEQVLDILDQKNEARAARVKYISDVRYRNPEKKKEVKERKRWKWVWPVFTVLLIIAVLAVMLVKFKQVF